MIEDQLENMADWVGMPTLLLTENSESKIIRILGLLGVFLLFPLVFIGLMFSFVAAIIGMFKEV